MTTTRRTALAMLGLGTATAVSAETFNAPPSKAGGVRTARTAYDRERYAKAFENLARELRRDSVEVQSIDLRASLEADTIADTHELTVRFIYKPEV